MTAHRHRSGVFQGMSPARRAALAVLTKVDGGGFAEDLLWDVLSAWGMSQRDRSLATELVYGTLRWKTRLDSLIDRHLEKPQKKMKPLIRQIFRIAVYQMVFLSRVPPYAVVDDAVRETRVRFGQGMASFVNATLRALGTSGLLHEPPHGKDAEALAVYYSHPRWLVKRWLKEFGEEKTERALEFNNQPAPMTCRINAIKTNMRDLFACLGQEGVLYESCLPRETAFRIFLGGREVTSLPSYQEGLYAIQGSASQLIAPLLQPYPGFRILDACAAPGGKTAHTAALCENNVFIVAVDASQKRLREMQQNMERLGASCSEFHAGDMRDAAWAGQLGTFDRILVDAPCSGLGVLRHNPDTRYRVREHDLALHASKQLQILKTAAGLLRPGGKLLYSVCTTTKEETYEVLEGIFAECPFLDMDPISCSEIPAGTDFISPEGLFESFPPDGDSGVDGFFAARFIHRGKRCEQFDQSGTTLKTPCS